MCIGALTFSCGSTLYFNAIDDLSDTSRLLLPVLCAGPGCKSILPYGDSLPHPCGSHRFCTPCRTNNATQGVARTWVKYPQRADDLEGTPAGFDLEAWAGPLGVGELTVARNHGRIDAPRTWVDERAGLTRRLTLLELDGPILDGLTEHPKHFCMVPAPPSSKGDGSSFDFRFPRKAFEELRRRQSDMFGHKRDAWRREKDRDKVPARVSGAAALVERAAAVQEHERLCEEEAAVLMARAREREQVREVEEAARVREEIARGQEAAAREREKVEASRRVRGW
ncbi:unnamed protein product [Discula destructiva]